MTVIIRNRGFIALAAFFVVFVVFASSCTNSKTRTRGGEESVSSTSAIMPSASATSKDTELVAPSCGHEVSTHGSGYDESARTCLWDAYRAGRPAQLALTRHTIEGDPITFTIAVRSSTKIEVSENNQDRFGARGVRSSACKTLERGPVVNGRSGFVVRGCEGGVETIEVP